MANLIGPLWRPYDPESKTMKIMSLKLAVIRKKSYLCERKVELHMPKIFEYFGFIFFFYSNEHEPIHVHVIKGEEDIVLEILLENGELRK